MAFFLGIGASGRHRELLKNTKQESPGILSLPGLPGKNFLGDGCLGCKTPISPFSNASYDYPNIKTRVIYELSLKFFIGKAQNQTFQFFQSAMEKSLECATSYTLYQPWLRQAYSSRLA